MTRQDWLLLLCQLGFVGIRLATVVVQWLRERRKAEDQKKVVVIIVVPDRPDNRA